jgi:hypothetical protein
MKRMISAWLLVSAAALSATACGGDDDDDSTGPSGGGESSQAGEPATGDGGATAAGGSGSNAGAPSTGNVACDESVDGVCQNPTDCPSVASGAARVSAGSCGQGCLSSSEENCAVDCIVGETSMTPECAACYAGAVACATQKCLADCIADPESDGCKLCQVEKGCRAAFNDCSGLPE